MQQQETMMQERAAASWRRRRRRHSSLPLSDAKQDDDKLLNEAHNSFMDHHHIVQKSRVWSSSRRVPLLCFASVTFVLTLLSMLSPQLWLPSNQSRNLRLPSSASPSSRSRINLHGVPLSQVSHNVFPYYSLSVLTRDQVSWDDFWEASPSTEQHNGEIENEIDQPILHFVHSRFMQEQGNLTALGMARLHLFEIFCLPTMVSQTTSNFFWLFRIDPDLDAYVVAQLLHLTKPYDNIYVIASNHNFRINEEFPGAWRDGAQAADLQSSRIYSGDAHRLSQALALVEDVLILDTRLDADDGLHTDYLRTVQSLARQSVRNDPQLQWKYWCVRRHLAWHWAIPSEKQKKYVAGSLMGSQNANLCITPGITVAFPVGTSESNVPVFAHHELIPRIANLPPEQMCSVSSESPCLDFVQKHSFEAIRSRTPTSAGMLAVLVETPELDPGDAWLEYALWDVLHDSFGLSRVQIIWMQSYLTQHLQQIGQDNLRGQCTTGHSCKVRKQLCGFDSKLRVLTTIYSHL